MGNFGGTSVRSLMQIAIILAMAFSMAASAQEDAALGNRVDASLDRALDEGRIVGAVVLVARDGQTIYHRAVGFLDREKGVKMKETALFRLSSVSKVFTSVAALALVEQGKLRLDDPVSRYLPSFSPALPDGSRPSITVRQLMNHTAGFNYGFFEEPDGPYHKAGVSDGFDQPGLILQENLDRISSVPLLYEPGTGWRYSLATDILGAVLESAAGKRLPEIILESLSEPLHLEASFAPQDTERLAVPYFNAPGKPARMDAPQLLPSGKSFFSFSPGRVFNSKSYPSGGAGVVATASDVLKLIETLRKGGAPILSTESVELLTADSLHGLKPEGLPPGWSFSLASAAVLLDPSPSATPQAKGTFAWSGVYGHSWFVDPTNRLSVVLLTNTALEGMSGKLPIDVRNAVYGK